MKYKVSRFIVAVFLLATTISCSKEESPVNPPVPPVPTPVDTSMVAYYAFAGSAFDSTLHHNDGQVFHAVLVEDRNGRAGQTYAFDGSSSYIKISESASLDLKGDVTIVAWIYPEIICGAGVGCDIVWHGDGQSAHDPYVLYNNHHAIGIRRDVGDGNQLNEALFPVDSTFIGKWQHVAGVYDTSTNSARVFINGSLVLERSFPDRPTINYTTSGFWTQIGAAGFATAGDNIGHFRGKIDEVRIYKRVLTASEIQSLYRK